jgi:hypothetical protein
VAIRFTNSQTAVNEGYSGYNIGITKVETGGKAWQRT